MSKGKPVIDPVESDAMAERLRKKLRAKLKRMPEKVIVEFGTRVRKVGLPTGTDWPDSFNRDRWYKTFGKSGDLAVERPASRTTAAKTAAAKTAAAKSGAAKTTPKTTD